MNNGLIAEGAEIPVGELKQQIEYARIISGDLFNLFAVNPEMNAAIINEYPVIGKKLSMILDFLFQAGLWCDVIESELTLNSEEEA